MALHEQCVGATDEWYTPPHVFETMRWQFDLDPCAPEEGRAFCESIRWSEKQFTKADDGLAKPWHGLVWMNPPFGGRNGLVPWLEKFAQHGNGVCLVPDRTSAPWWQTYAPQMALILFVAKKIKFISPDGSVGASPPQGTCLMAKGNDGCEALWAAHGRRLGFLSRPAFSSSSHEVAALPKPIEKMG